MQKKNVFNVHYTKYIMQIVLFFKLRAKDKYDFSTA